MHKLIRTKDKLLKKGKRNPADMNAKMLLEQVSNLLRSKQAQAKPDYYQALLTRSGQRDAWKIVNNALRECNQILSITINNG